MFTNPIAAGGILIGCSVWGYTPKNWFPWNGNASEQQNEEHSSALQRMMDDFQAQEKMNQTAAELSNQLNRQRETMLTVAQKFSEGKEELTQVKEPLISVKENLADVLKKLKEAQDKLMSTEESKEMAKNLMHLVGEKNKKAIQIKDLFEEALLTAKTIEEHRQIIKKALEILESQ